MAEDLLSSTGFCHLNFRLKCWNLRWQNPVDQRGISLLLLILCVFPRIYCFGNFSVAQYFNWFSISHKHDEIHSIPTYTARKADMPRLGIRKKWSHCRKEDDHRPPEKCNLDSQGHLVHLAELYVRLVYHKELRKKSSAQTFYGFSGEVFNSNLFIYLCSGAFLLGQAPMDNWTLSIEQVSSTLADHNVCTKNNNINAT